MMNIAVASLTEKNIKRYYVTAEIDSIKVYRAYINRQIAGITNSLTLFFPEQIQPANFSKKTFSLQSFDLNVLTILFKYRPLVKDYPAQLNTNFNGTLHGGFRKDIYTLA
jgi:hypothetical protein